MKVLITIIFSVLLLCCTSYSSDDMLVDYFKDSYNKSEIILDYDEYQYEVSFSSIDGLKISPDSKYSNNNIIFLEQGNHEITIKYKIINEFQSNKSEGDSLSIGGKYTTGLMNFNRNINKESYLIKFSYDNENINADIIYNED